MVNEGNFRTRQRKNGACVTFARKYIATAKKLSYETNGLRLNTASHASNRLYQSQFIVWSIKMGLTKSLLFKAIDWIAQINLVTSKNSEIMAGPQYPQTRRSLLKAGRILNYHISIVFAQ